PPAQVLAADQRVTAWARELGKAGLEGGMDALRARAFLDIMLGMDSRPIGSHTDGTSPAPATGTGLGPASGGPLAGMIPPGFAGHVTLTIPEATVTGRADRPGDLSGIGPVDPDLARDLAAAAARNPRSTWCVTVTDKDGHAVGHGCARPAKRRKPDGSDPPGGPGFTFTPADQPGPPGGYGTWRFTTGQQDLLIKIGPIPAEDCDHRWEARGHDPGVMLRHLTEVRHATCTGPGCRRPAARADFEHNIPYDAGGRTCLCNGNPKCRSDHRLKQHPRWNAEQLPGGYVRWTAPSGRQYVTEPTRYPI
ncbi:MAG TPA: HNH endonuclease signature motif containing protein, partial [Streptosporangiaceae bacterium]|nr:HNH endonuclease signature motif containing protein [Streptosporangiaceae bacterium]